MSARSTPDTIEMIAIDEIYILNPRDRNRTKFRKVIRSISEVGLKRPIKVSRTSPETTATSSPYTLICGQGRLEAFKELGQTHIPALVVTLSEEDCYVQSLVENMARRTPASLDTARQIARLADTGYAAPEIARKTGLSREYVVGLLRLVRQGEDRLLQAVEQNKIPISIAVDIATAETEDAQSALTQAYEHNQLRGQKLQTAMRLVRDRERWGKGIKRPTQQKKTELTVKAMVRHYQRETERQRTLIRRADLTEARLVVIRRAIEVLFADEHFRTLLRAEGLDTLPSQLAEFVDPELIAS